MKFSITAKSILASVFFSLGAVPFRLKSKAAAGFAILMYHRVIPTEKAKKGVQAGMYVDPKTFRKHLFFLKKYFNIVSLTDIFSTKEKLVGHNKPFCAITFDDGWYDFYQYAFPILKEYKVPATVFLATDYIGTNDWFWTDRLAHILLGKLGTKKILARSSENPIAERLMKLSGSFELRLETSIGILKDLRIENIEEILSELSELWVASSRPGERAFLSWDEVREMRKTGLVSFGSHTATHPILTTLKLREIKEELIRSKEKLIAEGVVDGRVDSILLSEWKSYKTDCRYGKRDWIQPGCYHKKWVEQLQGRTFYFKTSRNSSGYEFNYCDVWMQNSEYILNFEGIIHKNPLPISAQSTFG